MYKLLIIITLQLFPTGVVKKTTEEIYLTPTQDCMTELDKVNNYFNNKNKNQNLRLLSVACSELGRT